MDYDKLHTLAQAIWIYVETYTLPHSDQTRRSFRLGDTDHGITPDSKGIAGAIARLAIFFDEYVDNPDMPDSYPPTLPTEDTP